MSNVFSVLIFSGILIWGFGQWYGVEGIKYHGYMIWVVGILFELLTFLIKKINNSKVRYYLGWFTLIISVVFYVAILFVNKPLVPLWLHAALMSLTPVALILGSKSLNKELGENNV